MPRKPTFSLFLPQAAFSYEMIKERAVLLESLGYDGLWLVDHMWPEGFPDVDFLEGWTAVAALAEATERLRLGLLVSCNSYRNPGIVAKMATTVDHISNGRLELGLGAGWQEDEYRGYGFEFPPVPTRLEQLAEALEIITSLLTNDRTTVEGRHYQFRDAPLLPKPIQKPLPITIGGAGKNVMLRLVARYAHRWNCPMPDAHRMPELLAALAAHCEAVGRDMDEITVSEQTAIVLGRDRDDLELKRQMAKAMIGGFVDLRTMAVIGTPEEVAHQLSKKMELGVSDFAIMFGDFGMPETLELFASRVVPALSGD